MSEILLCGDGFVHSTNFTPTCENRSPADWLAKCFSHRSAPAIKPIKGGYTTLNRTLTKEEFLEHWRSTAEIIALRFGSETNRIVIDIDVGSQHHPSRNPEAFSLILATLEDVGLCAPIIYQSSDSGGLHVLYPIEERSTYATARTVEMALARADFWLKNGELEAYPNRKAWVDGDRPYEKGRYYSELFDYQAVRVPCQVGCVLLDECLEPIGDNSLSEFRHRWEWAIANQDMEAFDDVIEHYADTSNWPKKPRKYGKLADIEADYLELLATGWTANGETNEILGNLARLTRIMDPCSDDELVSVVMEKAIAMPGYRQHCRHQHEIEQRCRDWARHIIKRGYYYHGNRIKTEPTASKKNINQERQDEAIQRTKGCLKGFIKQGFTFASKTRIVNAVVKAVGGSNTTIIKHWDKFISLAKVLLTITEPETTPSSDSEGNTGATPGASTHPPLLRVCIPEVTFREKEKLLNSPPPTPAGSDDTLRNSKNLTQHSFWGSFGGDDDA